MKRKIRESCYKKYTVYLCSVNIGITICTTASLITIVHDIFRLSKESTWNGTRLVSYGPFQIIIYEPKEHFTKFDICHIVRSLINNRKIVSYVTWITTTHICFREHCAVHFPTYRNEKINYTYRVFNDCTNLCGNGENFRNTKKPTINMLPEHQFPSNYE